MCLKQPSPLEPFQVHQKSAMEIIDEVEPVKRGVFGGAVGYLGWHGEMDMSIAIRTCVYS